MYRNIKFHTRTILIICGVIVSIYVSNLISPFIIKQFENYNSNNSTKYSDKSIKYSDSNKFNSDLNSNILFMNNKLRSKY